MFFHYERLRERVLREALFLQTIAGKDKAFPTAATPEGIFTIANGVILTFFTLLALIFLVMMLYGGYNWMTAMGEEEKVTKAKDTIIASVIGVVILISGYAITTFIITNIYGNVASQ